MSDVPTEGSVTNTSVVTATTESTAFDVDLEELTAQWSSSNGVAVMQAVVTAIDARPLSVRVRARSAAGPSPYSAWTPGIPSSCSPSEFLTTHLSVAEWTCRPCDLEASLCDGGSTFTLAARAGYQRLPWVPGRAAFSRCLRPESCLSLARSDGIETSGSPAVFAS